MPNNRSTRVELWIARTLDRDVELLVDQDDADDAGGSVDQPPFGLAPAAARRLARSHP